MRSYLASDEDGPSDTTPGTSDDCSDDNLLLDWENITVDSQTDDDTELLQKLYNAMLARGLHVT